jgi:hypothetical protein
VHEKQEVAADLNALLDCLKQQTELASKRKQQGQVGAFNQINTLFGVNFSC